jgi:uncharacterized protein (UPF0303 family)
VTYTLNSLAAEQQKLLLHDFDYSVAWKLGCLIQEKAAVANLPVSITVAHGTDVVFLLLMPGATIDNLQWAARKRAVAHRFHRSSLAMRLEAESGNFDFNSRYRLPEADYVASGGGVPLILRNGTLIGTVGVSGLPDEDDHRLVVQALEELFAH